MKRAYQFIRVLMIAASAGGCTGSSDTSVAETTAVAVGPTVPPAGAVTTIDPRADDQGRLTTAQALTLSRMLIKNEEAKGAVAKIEVPFGTAARFTLSGPVDWAGDRGSFVLVAKRSDDVAVPDSTVIWDRGAVLTEPAGLEQAMAAKGRPGVKFAARAMDPSKVALDQVITFVGSLAIDRAENPILLRQGDTAFLGTNVIDGVTLDGYRFGKTRYFVDPSTGLLRRVEATFARYQEPVIITLTNHGPQTITVPSADVVVDAATIPDVMASLKAASDQ
jgi:hypothetical protein